MMRAIDVECRTGGCRAAGQVRRVALRLVALGVVEVPTLLCVHCGCAPERVGGWWCDEVEEGMPKITVHGGATNAALDGLVLVGEAGPELVAADEDGRPLVGPQPTPVEPDEEGGEPSSPGGSSSTSPAKPSSTGKKSATAPRKPARTTGSR